DILKAVDEGLFNVWAIDTVDDGIEILTGIKAGTMDKNGKYPRGTVNRKVQDGLELFYKQYVKYAKETQGCLGK
ncbi:MAG: hypothetical protein IKA03_01800, partial [Alphaproteobacteria bacterium]|nr:hypothetical protein [Alphaproteobacteria bacterium]